ncbi:MAG: DUF5131 family protein [Oscillospiraceae bacterium]|nr:DUF5131 family protein [Oscillospiraceae bacterium]
MPLLLELPFKHKGVMCAPFIGPVSLRPWLASGQIERVKCGGENYDGSRPCDFAWVKALRQECVDYNVTFCFIETGTNFIKDGRLYRMSDKRVQSEMAYKSDVNFQGKGQSQSRCGPLHIFQRLRGGRRQLGRGADCPGAWAGQGGHLLLRPRQDRPGYSGIHPQRDADCG